MELVRRGHAVCYRKALQHVLYYGLSVVETCAVLTAGAAAVACNPEVPRGREGGQDPWTGSGSPGFAADGDVTFLTPSCELVYQEQYENWLLDIEAEAPAAESLQEATQNDKPSHQRLPSGKQQDRPIYAHDMVLTT